VPQYKITPAMSLMAYCDTQEEIDTLWQKLSAGGGGAPASHHPGRSGLADALSLASWSKQPL